jgi:hypothetical protein
LIVERNLCVNEQKRSRFLNHSTLPCLGDASARMNTFSDAS